MSEFWLSATATPMLVVSTWPPESTRDAVERLVAGVVALRRLAAADLRRARVLGHRARGVDRVVRLDRLARLRRVAAGEAVLAGLERIRRHRRGRRLGADLLRCQALLRRRVELSDVVLRQRRGRRAGEGRQHGADGFLDVALDGRAASRRRRGILAGASCHGTFSGISGMNRRPRQRAFPTTSRQRKGARRRLFIRATGYLPSRSESPGTARSTLSLRRCHESRTACLARSQVRLDLPRALSQSRERSDSTSSKRCPG